MNLTQQFLERVQGLFPVCPDYEVVRTWEVPFNDVAQCAADGLPTVHIPFPGATSPMALNFWQSFYLTAIREAGRGCSLLVKHHPERASLNLLLVRKGG